MAATRSISVKFTADTSELEERLDALVAKVAELNRQMEAVRRDADERCARCRTQPEA